jgi:hypothetical protein
MVRMSGKNKIEKKPYIIIETDATGIDWKTNGNSNLEDTLTPHEWETLEALFAKHPSLVKIVAPYRDTETGGKMCQH